MSGKAIDESVTRFSGRLWLTKPLAGRGEMRFRVGLSNPYEANDGSRNYLHGSRIDACDEQVRSVRLHHVHTSLDEYPEPLKGTVRTPTVASGRGYCLQTAHLESRHFHCFSRKPADLPNYRGREGS